MVAPAACQFGDPCARCGRVRWWYADDDKVGHTADTDASPTAAGSRNQSPGNRTHGAYPPITSHHADPSSAAPGHALSELTLDR